jgi:hypothetical protein
MFDSNKFDKVMAMLFGSSNLGEAENAFSALKKMMEANNVAPSDLHVSQGSGGFDYHRMYEANLAELRKTWEENNNTLRAHIQALQLKITSFKSAERKNDEEVTRLKAVIAELELRGVSRGSEAEISELQAEVARLKGDLEAAQDLLDEPNRETGTFGHQQEEDLAAYQREDGVNQATVKREFRKVVNIRFGWKTCLWHLLQRRGVTVCKGTLYGWLRSTTRELPGKVLEVIRAEAQRLADSGATFGGAEWVKMQKEYLYGFSY